MGKNSQLIGKNSQLMVKHSQQMGKYSQTYMAPVYSKSLSIKGTCI